MRSLSYTNTFVCLPPQVLANRANAAWVESHAPGWHNPRVVELLDRKLLDVYRKVGRGTAWTPTHRRVDTLAFLALFTLSTRHAGTDTGMALYQSALKHKHTLFQTACAASHLLLQWLG
eukprot:360284-Chlamydomonas_euryale.AAC.4